MAIAKKKDKLVPWPRVPMRMKECREAAHFYINQLTNHKMFINFVFFVLRAFIKAYPDSNSFENIRGVVRDAITARDKARISKGKDVKSAGSGLANRPKT